MNLIKNRRKLIVRYIQCIILNFKYLDNVSIVTLLDVVVGMCWVLFIATVAFKTIHIGPGIVAVTANYAHTLIFW